MRFPVLVTSLTLSAIWGVSWNAHVAYSLAIDFGRYHAADEMLSILKEAASERPDLVTVVSAGQSQMGREISYAIIQRKGAKPQSALYFNGAHHGNEWPSSEAALALLQKVVSNPDDPLITEALDKYAIIIQPVVNPDGHTHQTRETASGSDPNRDYPFPLRADEESFKTPETKIVRSILNVLPSRAAIAYHSGMEGVLWPSCFTDKPTLHHNLFYSLARKTAAAMGMGFFQQSWRDYPTEGEFIDYAYMKSRSLALTFEISRDGIPAETQLQGVVDRALKGSLSFVRSILDIDRGNFQVQTEPQSHRKSFPMPMLASFSPAN